MILGYLKIIMRLLSHKEKNLDAANFKLNLNKKFCATQKIGMSHFSSSKTVVFRAEFVLKLLNYTKN